MNGFGVTLIKVMALGTNRGTRRGRGFVVAHHRVRVVLLVRDSCVAGQERDCPACVQRPAPRQGGAVNDTDIGPGTCREYGRGTISAPLHAWRNRDTAADGRFAAVRLHPKILELAWNMRGTVGDYRPKDERVLTEPVRRIN